MTYIIDAHEDIAYNALAFARDFHLSVHEIRARERRIPTLLPRRVKRPWDGMNINAGKLR